MPCAHSSQHQHRPQTHPHSNGHTFSFSQHFLRVLVLAVHFSLLLQYLVVRVLEQRATLRSTLASDWKGQTWTQDDNRRTVIHGWKKVSVCRRSSGSNVPEMELLISWRCDDSQREIAFCHVLIMAMHEPITFKPLGPRRTWCETHASYAVARFAVQLFGSRRTVRLIICQRKDNTF